MADKDLVAFLIALVAFAIVGFGAHTIQSNNDVKIAKTAMEQGYCSTMIGNDIIWNKCEEK